MNEKIQDVLTYKQKIFEEITDFASSQVLRDEILYPVLLELKKSPRTILELSELLSKSDKTVYRYINKLETLGLVVQAGKRMEISRNNKIKTHTLYSSSAKIYYDTYFEKEIDDNITDDENAKYYNKIMSTIASLVGQNYSNKKGDNGKLWELNKEISRIKRESFQQLLINANDDTIHTLSFMALKDLIFVIDMIGELSVLRSKNWIEDVASCFK
ncbi:MAG: ArsR family transcriptional regulator [Candidatus Heimdallarchaeota archaeon]|nr:ArsR family transcriptional regulator [Candidatus Heimdallarchaeota archaeon]